MSSHRQIQQIRRSSFALLALGMVWLLVPVPALALQDGRPIATDSRIRTVRYSGNEVYQFIGHYGYQSTIEFEADEKILTVSIGDSIAWMINPSTNRLFLKPIEQNALTNMTVITDKRSYLFELHAEETQDIRDPNMVFVLRFVYPGADGEAVQFTQFEQAPDFENHPEKFNFAYTMQGSNVIEPLRIFDDGQFTFFEFRDKNAEIPAFFRVDSVGNEELVNFRKRGDFIVVERVTSQFTLRRGADIICVFNERMPMQRIPEPIKPLSERIRNYSPF